MQEQITSTPARINEVPDFADRFWFWQGASGTRYIHSIYQADQCPPLPGAVFIAVRRMRDGTRIAVSAGKFSSLWAKPLSGCNQADEVHVHLLAEGEAAAGLVLADLKEALFEKCEFGTDDPAGFDGFSEPEPGNLFDNSGADRELRQACPAS